MNYYDEISDKVELLWHFPYPNFSAFKEAVEKGEVVNTGIPMDYARQWVTQGVSAPKGWMIFSNILLVLPYLLTIFYIVTAFTSRNYWLILYSVVPIIFMFFFNPLARRAFKMHYYFIGIYVLVGIFIKSLWEPIYWLPLVVDYLALNQLYEGSAQLVRENLHKNEKLLCWFWKRGNLQIELKDGSKWADRYVERDGKTEFYGDVDKEWREYIDKQDKNNTSSSTKQSEIINSKNTLDQNQQTQNNVDVSLTEVDTMPHISPDRDTIYNDVLKYLRGKEKVSVEILQKQFGIGYARAARIMDHLNEDGYLTTTEQDIQDENRKNIGTLIEKTLEAHGILTRVAEINVKANGVEYCLEVQVGSSLENIMKYERNIALAVASPTGKVKIQAPIPGRSLIGIFVPSKKKK